jgi:hypothetical protein
MINRRLCAFGFVTIRAGLLKSGYRVLDDLMIRSALEIREPAASVRTTSCASMDRMGASIALAGKTVTVASDVSHPGVPPVVELLKLLPCTPSTRPTMQRKRLAHRAPEPSKPARPADFI